MWSPGFVHHQRHAAVVGDSREALHVGDGPEIGGGHRQGGDRVRRRVERLAERLRSKAVSDAELRVELGSEERRLEPGEDDPVHRARVDVSLGDHRPTGVTKRETGGVVSLRRAADQEPASAGPPRLRRQPLSPLKRRILSDVDALDPGGNVVVERRRTERRDQDRIGAGSSLVTWDVEATRTASRVVDERVEIWSLPLGPSPKRLRPASDIGVCGLSGHPPGL